LLGCLTYTGQAIMTVNPLPNDARVANGRRQNDHTAPVPWRHCADSQLCSVLLLVVVTQQ
jgi:hypothetical protein